MRNGLPFIGSTLGDAVRRWFGRGASRRGGVEQVGKRALLDDTAIDDVFGRFRADSRFFHPVEGTFFGGFDESQPDERAEMASALFAVEGADQTFTMVSLGAAPGEWAIKTERAFRAVRPQGVFAAHLLEAEADHFELIKSCLALNGVSPADHHVSYRAIADRDGFAYFPITDPVTDWGAGIAAIASDARHLDQSLIITDVALRDRLGVTGQSELTYRTVPAVSLGTLFGETGMVDYLHSDIQGTEGDVFCSAMPAMDANVRVACIATHGRTIEKRLQDAFAAHGWIAEAAFPCESHEDSLGEIVTKDGIFVWSNPRFGAFP